MTQNFDLKKLTFTSCVRAVASAQRFHPGDEDTVCGGDCKPWLPHCLQCANTDTEFDYFAPAGRLCFHVLVFGLSLLQTLARRKINTHPSRNSPHSPAVHRIIYCQDAD